MIMPAGCQCPGDYAICTSHDVWGNTDAETRQSGDIELHCGLFNGVVLTSKSLLWGWHRNAAQDGGSLLDCLLQEWGLSCGSDSI